ncbi:reverse transcriptase-like protein [Novosphingobium flavum]|uniref:Reverse transcriptase-like protein n=1 Tax=Novosphingobium flavum TaxID=1778672 RepID=A0A7X1KL65_9SPHN|nr:reverse transcriptase-like protein [Novosphingobium flavum]MBC2665232.1 reverse transcriptase-like protein [Novosphingobium flavum]
MSSGSPASPERSGAAASAPLKLWFDGACRPNPGAMSSAVAARGRVWLESGLGHGDNNDAEWLALLHALRVARELGASDIILLGDSALVVAQASGRAPCRGARFAAALAQFRADAQGFARLRLRHVGRAQNLAGIALERAFGRL